jgi:hypothetical protein
VGWKTIPSWYVIGDADKVIPPDIQLTSAMTTAFFGYLMIAWAKAKQTA